MPLVVQKFGGTSVADSQKILAAARKAVRAHQTGSQVVMVVSAMGKNTDTLIGLAQEVNERPPAREMDMLLSTGEQVSVALMAMAIDSLGYKAVSLTGAQIGIKTDSSHTKARIHSISTDRIKNLLDEGNIVIAAGFQGIDDNLNITTLGRGGSDTTAVALSAVLGAEQESWGLNNDVKIEQPAGKPKFHFEYLLQEGQVWGGGTELDYVQQQTRKRRSLAMRDKMNCSSAYKDAKQACTSTLSSAKTSGSPLASPVAWLSMARGRHRPRRQPLKKWVQQAKASGWPKVKQILRTAITHPVWNGLIMAASRFERNDRTNAHLCCSAA